MSVSFWAWPVSILVGLLLSYLTYKKLVEKSRNWLIPATFRFMGIALLVWLLFSPTLLLKSVRLEKPVIQLYGDYSLSCRDNVDSIIKYLDREIQIKYGEKVSIRRLCFAEDLTLINNWDSVRGTGQFELTRLDKVQTDLLESSEEVAASIIVSDGIVNKGQSPILQGKSKHSLFIVGVGDTSVYSDFSIESINANKEVYEGNSTQIEIDIKALQCAGKKAEIEIWNADKKITSKYWTPKSNKDKEKISLSVKSSTNQLKLRAFIKSKEIEETNITNNSRIKFIDVVKRKKQVWIIYGKLNPDIKVLSNVINSSNRYAVKTISEDDVRDILADICIFHGIQKSQLIQDCNNREIPFWTFLNSPSSVVVANRISGAKITKLLRSKWQSIIAGQNEAFNDYLTPNESLLLSWGAIESPILKASAIKENILLYQVWNDIKTEYPLFFKSGSQKNQLWFLGENIWKWNLQHYKHNSNSQGFKDWVMNNINWLNLDASTRKGIKCNMGDGEWVRGRENIISIIEKDAAGRIRMDTKLKAEITDSSGKKTEIPLVKNAQSYKMGYVPTNSGLHQINVRSNLNPEGTTVFWSVKEQSVENTNKVARFNLLRNWVSHNNGDFIKATELKKIFVKLDQLKLESARSFEDSKQSSLNELGFILAILILCFSIEWFLRKWLGKI
ncbi:MAG: hypothetical protein ACON5K_02895 [Bacteroidia bacterium]